MDADGAREWLEQHDVRWVRTESVTPDGLVVGKHLSPRKFVKGLPTGNAVTEFVLGYDLGGTPYLAWWDEWRRDALGDFHQRPDLDTLAMVPDRPGTAAVMCDIVDLDGREIPACPRSLLRRVVSRLDSDGYTVRAAFELEAMIFAESDGEARRKHFRDLTPLSLPVALGYLHQNSRAQLAVVDEVLTRLDALGIPVEGWHDEAAPGQLEINFDPADPITAADRLVRTKQVLREVAAEHGHVVTFAAKPTDAYGNGLHVHHSLAKDGEPVFYAPDGAMSETTRHWLGGLMTTMPGAVSIMCPTINSYRRMVGWAAAPTVASWAEDNKSTAIRVLSRSPGAARIEHRVAAADANPYLVLAVALAGGIAGLEKAIEPPEPLAVAGWGLPAGYPHLPNTITRAADALAGDELLRGVLGDGFCDFWVNTRRWEWLMFHTTGGDPTATTVTQWELDRYFELV